MSPSEHPGDTPLHKKTFRILPDTGIAKKFNVVLNTPGAWSPEELLAFGAERARLLPLYEETTVRRGNLGSILHREPVSGNLIQERPGYPALDRRLALPFQPFLATYPFVHLRWREKDTPVEHILFDSRVLVCHGIQQGANGPWLLEGVFYEDGQRVPVADLIRYCRSIGETPQVLAVCREGADASRFRIQDPVLEGLIHVTHGPVTISATPESISIQARRGARFENI